MTNEIRWIVKKAAISKFNFRQLSIYIHFSWLSDAALGKSTMPEFNVPAGNVDTRAFPSG